MPTSDEDDHPVTYTKDMHSLETKIFNSQQHLDQTFSSVKETDNILIEWSNDYYYENVGQRLYDLGR